MATANQQEQARAFLALHHADKLLVLPNAWDVVSARIYELEGFTAIGTTSAGIAATLGFPDGQRIAATEMIAAVRRIVKGVRVPVSADLEAGYSQSPEGVAQSARAALEAGAVGINLEDSTGDPSNPLFDEARQAEKIIAVREMASSTKIHLVINARTDVYLHGTDKPEKRPTAAARSSAGPLGEAIHRANTYRETGADCVFVPDNGTLAKETIARLVKEIDAPLNIIVGERTPPLRELEEIGVARVSFGPRPMRVALALIRSMAREWRDTGSYTCMRRETLTYDEVNRMFD